MMVLIVLQADDAVQCGAWHREELVGGLLPRGQEPPDQAVETSLPGKLDISTGTCTATASFFLQRQKPITGI